MNEGFILLLNSQYQLSEISSRLMITYGFLFQMFEKFIGNKKKKQGDIFSIPQKKYTTDQKLIGKMAAKPLIDLYHDQEKYINLLVQKIQLARQQYQKQCEKADELSQKNDVINNQIVRMTNEHQQLTIKYENLQTSLEIFSSENQALFKKEIDFMKQNDINTDKVKNISSVLANYRQKVGLCKKIEQQNKSLKSRYAELQEKLEEAEEKLKELQKDKNYNHMIPSLLDEIKDLKEKQKPKENFFTENPFFKFQQQITQKLKNQIQTVSSFRSEEQQQEIKQNLIELQKLKKEVQILKDKNASLQKMNLEMIFNIDSYNQKIKVLTAQNQEKKTANDQMKRVNSKLEEQLRQIKSKLESQVLKLKKAEALASQLQKSRENQQKLRQNLAAIENNLKLKLTQSNQLTKKLDLVNNQLRSRNQQLQKQRQNRAQFQDIMSNKSNSQVQNLLQLKAKLQKQLSQSKKAIQAERKNVIQIQSKFKQSIEQLQAAKTTIKRLVEQKSIIQQTANHNINAAHEESQSLTNEANNLRNSLQVSKKEAEVVLAKVKSYEQQIRNFSIETQKLAKTIQSKDNQLRKIYATLQQQQKEKISIMQQINDKQEDSKIRGRKYQSQLNQERIKLQSLNRKLGIFEAQVSQNKTSMDNMYEQLLGKDKKMSHMQIKLKQYKHMIQVLRKEKQDIQNNYQSKLSSLHPQQVTTKLSIVKQEDKPSSQRQKMTEQEIDLLKNQLYSLKEQNIAILAQNEKLRGELTSTDEILQQKDRSIKVLQQKRDQMLKEIQKIGKNPKTAQQYSGLGSFASPKQQPSKTEIFASQGRDKKIASKALKGFEIMLKQQHSLYKRFMQIFAQKMQEEDIKGLQKQINILIKKSADMKDVFEGYLE